MTQALVHPLWGSLALDREGERSLQDQVVTYFRSAIVEGRLRRGLRLPSSRQLSRDHGISRTTAVEAYDRLAAEGYLVSRPGSGIFIADHIPEDFTLKLSSARSRPTACTARAQSAPLYDFRAYHLPLAPGMPAVELFPWAEWNRHFAAVMRERPVNLIAHGEPMGERPLREALADCLAAMKGISCNPDQIVVVGGTVEVFAQALSLLCEPGMTALVEDPSYPFIRDHARRLGLACVAGGVDRHGMDVERALASAPDARLVCVSPSHSAPSGSCLSLARREALVDWADRNEGWIIEHEFDGDFRFDSLPLPTCYSLSRKNRVVLVGSVSRPFAPGLRVGYLVLPPELVPLAQEQAIPQPSVAIQLALARMCNSGALAAHLRMLRTVHERRRLLLLDALSAQAGGALQLIHAPEAGLRVLTALPNGVDDVALARRALEAGLRVEALSPCAIDRTTGPGLVLGFGSTEDAQIAPAIERLVGLIQDVR